MPNGGRSAQFEQTYRIAKFRRYLPVTEARPEALIQFYSAQGGMRTWAVKDIVDISR